MKILKILAASVIGAAGFVTAAFADDGRYILLMKSKNSVPGNLASQVESAGGTLVRTIPQVGVAVATSSDPNFAANAKSIGAVKDAGPAAVSTLPESVATAEPDMTPTAADDLYNSGLVWGVDRVGAPAAWANGHTGSHDTIIAIIDTGIAWNHPDLASNVVYVDCYTSAGSFADGACNPYPSLSDHGTHVAGSAAASFDGGRVVGVAPEAGLAGYNTFEVIPDCGVCSFTDSRWAAMVDAADRGFSVISMSLGGTAQYGGQGTNGLATYVAAEKRVANYVNKQGTVMVASAGNSALDLNGTIIHVPGDIPQIMNVGATGIQPAPRFPFPNSFDIRAFYSNYGAPLTVTGPGGDCGEISTCSGNPVNGYFYAEFLVLSSIVAPDPVCAATASCPVGYGWKGGTSMATPHVSAVVSLVRDAEPGLKPNQVEARVKQTAENIGSRQDFGHGMVRADLATE
ncbi:S8 family serine peptidase [Hyphococcus flavus]|uniref:S8 family serine peptidase n=1 Tax=Hyphococcus flavus TaxID=1866326 RepID=A0AAF0CEJ5_9PROT|nr:S8 family serine peptidase [Hyphococcus flavus]WDI31376.1 S8 family serine peptidase [Hyphococcus flavus]